MKGQFWMKIGTKKWGGGSGKDGEKPNEGPSGISVKEGGDLPCLSSTKPGDRLDILQVFACTVQKRETARRPSLEGRNILKSSLIPF